MTFYRLRNVLRKRWERIWSRTFRNTSRKKLIGREWSTFSNCRFPMVASAYWHFWKHIVMQMHRWCIVSNQNLIYQKCAVGIHEITLNFKFQNSTLQRCNLIFKSIGQLRFNFSWIHRTSACDEEQKHRDTYIRRWAAIGKICPSKDRTEEKKIDQLCRTVNFKVI